MVMMGAMGTTSRLSSFRAASSGAVAPKATSLCFAAAARSLGRAARLRGLVVPCFRSPPALPDVNRTIRRGREVPTVAVRLRDRPWSAVLADMVEGVVVANELTGARADRVRAVLWLAVDEEAAEAA